MPPKRKKAATLWEQLVILMGGQELELPLNKIALQTNLSDWVGEAEWGLHRQRRVLRNRKDIRKPSRGWAVSPLQASFELVNSKGGSGSALTVQSWLGATSALVWV